MVRFVHEEYLYLLLLIPAALLVAWWVWRVRRKAVERFAAPFMFQRLAPQASVFKRPVKFGLLLFATAFLALALANLQIGTRLEEVKQEGADLFIVLDLSLSMKAEDIKPNRLEKAKLEIHNLIDRLGGDRIGLIVFAGEAYTQFPLTTDYSAANLFLDVLDVDAVSLPGTAIGVAIERAMESFDFKEQTSKVIVIITDGENTEGDVFEAAEAAAAKGVLLYTIGMGSPTGAPIPVYNASGRQTDFKRDRMGNVVVSKLDEASLEKIALIGNGKYFRGTTSQDELDAIYKDVSALQKKEFGVKQFTDFEDRFQFFLAPALVLLVLEFLLSERKTPWLSIGRLLRRQEEVTT
ncbi:MAG: VWA domain-containing protein [Bacteroidetes bacterium]|nr:VWA domain-containing protein [Bacteroidota bacterium]